ncbi:MAG: zinc-ribbon domain-containing protein [Candidatus Bathyarchaeia archaeon]
MPYCRRCGVKLEENARFCQKCGTQVVTFNPPVSVVPAPRKLLSTAEIILIAVAIVVIIVVASVFVLIVFNPANTNSINSSNQTKFSTYNSPVQTGKMQTSVSTLEFAGKTSFPPVLEFSKPDNPQPQQQH